jgi:hypothetical protein
MQRLLKRTQILQQISFLSITVFLKPAQTPDENAKALSVKKKRAKG